MNEQCWVRLCTNIHWKQFVPFAAIDRRHGELLQNTTNSSDQADSLDPFSLSFFSLFVYFLDYHFHNYLRQTHVLEENKDTTLPCADDSVCAWQVFCTPTTSRPSLCVWANAQKFFYNQNTSSASLITLALIIFTSLTMLRRCCALKWKGKNCMIISA